MEKQPSVQGAEAMRAKGRASFGHGTGSTEPPRLPRPPGSLVLSVRSSPAGVTGELKLAKPGRVFPAAERENGIKSIQIRAGSREKP